MKYIGKEMKKNKFVPRKILIVDGYNVINAWSKLKQISKDNLEEARDKLISNIQEYAKLKGYDAYVVFDAYNVKGCDEKLENHHGITVIFTRENQTADSYIEKFISGLSKYDEIAVATSDYAEQQIVLGKGCTRISSRELIGDLNNAKEELRNSNKNTTKKYNDMNRLENRIDSDILNRLENMRRNRK
ncbi:NYN domain-containing protein [Peptostreptococcus porci]|uniref:NYN domain-containing protein n=1 Tax=Peptostreptococcus porci TaxID=2652282 RepID=UPI002A917A92|nr:NYN domain-containing protein [Peptostreptococcus porci]MDY5435685.1 NYN domain-containing protein [Peptostreptococcus porci]